MNEGVVNKYYPRVMWPMWFAVLALMLLSVFSIFSATEMNTNVDMLRSIIKQGAGFFIGISVAIAICFLDYKTASRWALVLYWLTVITLILVLIVGVVRGGSRRWFYLGPIQIQPSEFAKLAFIFALGNFLSRPLPELVMSETFYRGIAMMALPFGLILLEPDLGSALVLIPVGFMMMLIGGISQKYLFRLVGGSMLLVILLLVDILILPPNLQMIKLHDYQERRLMTFFGMDYARRAASEEERRQLSSLQDQDSYNVEQALISIGSGGSFGKGWRKGTNHTLGYLPSGVAHNDFIFSVIAEEHGFFGSVVVITLYSVVLISGMWIAGQARDRLGQLLAVGVVTLWFSHVFINIGMNIGIMPVTGLPLPLLSYGGSSVVSSLIAIGILQNVYFYRRSY